MSNQNAYEIRLGIIMQAKSIAFETWQNKCLEVRDNASGGAINNGYTLPPAPSVKDILKIADELYAFVGGVGSAHERKK